MELKKIIFRADGNSEVGLGHLSRLFSLVEMLKDKYKCFFLTKSDSFIEIIPKEYNVDIIPKNILFYEEPNWIYKKYSSSEFIIIADGYSFTSNYQKELKKYGFKLIYIDDLVNEKMYADIVINHSLNITAEDYTVNNNNTIYALGSDYALLRPQFIHAARKSREIKQINEVFICFGGVDYYNLSNRVLKGIVNIESIKKIHVVVGEFYDDNKSLNSIIRENSKVFVYKNISEEIMIKLMNKCHLAIIPSSTISYEACSVKMIILGGYYVKNQERINKGLDLNGLIYNVGDFKKLKSIDFKHKVLDIINDFPENHKLKLQKQSIFFDGNQKERIDKLIYSLC
tara:strand:- start:566 stop:1591 length:1026 start_codon:yes stop_codon:yes gene_type:complete